MSLEDLEQRVRKLSMRATDAKMALHDLSEELPIDWQKIPEVAEKTHAVFKELHDARAAVMAAKLAAKDA